LSGKKQEAGIDISHFNMHWYKRAKEEDKGKLNKLKNTLSITKFDDGGYAIASVTENEEGVIETECILVPKNVKIIKNELV